MTVVRGSLRGLSGWLAMLMVVSHLFTPAVSAQDGTPIAPAIEEPASGESAEIPAEPTPTSLPPEPEPTATAEPPAPPPTMIPEPTATPAASLSYQLHAEPECTIAAGQPDALASGGAIEYACVSRLTIDGARIAAAGLTVSWQITTSAAPGWEARLLPPVRAPGETATWTAFHDGQSFFTFDQLDPAGSSAEPGTFNTTPSIEYRVQITRPNCEASVPLVKLSHTASVTSPHAIATDLAAGAIREPLALEPVLAAVAPPSVSFDSGLDFGTISATAAGLSETRIEGSLGITVSGLDRACGTWNLQLSATSIVDEQGDVRDGFALLFGECDLTNGCLAASFVAGPGAPATQSLTLTFTLQAPQFAALGALGTTLDATLVASGGT